MHDPAPFSSLQIALVPQGEGLQGCAGSLIGVTKINVLKHDCWYYDKFLTFLTSRKRIARKSLQTVTNWRMINSSTFSIIPTRTWTWIYTSLVLTCFCLSTLWINSAFGSTIWRLSKVVYFTRTYGSIIYYCTFGEKAARCR